MGLSDQDPIVTGTDPDPDRSTMKLTKYGKPWFLLFCVIFYFLSLKNDVNVASKINKQKDYFVLVS